MFATSCFPTVLECIIFVFGRGSAPGPTGEPLADLMGPTSKRQGRGKGKERGKGRGGEGTRVTAPTFHKFLDPPLRVVTTTCANGNEEHRNAISRKGSRSPICRLYLQSE